MRDKKNFAVFILTHGRPNEVVTYDVLRTHGYTGKIYIIIDNEDATADQYRERYGEQVIQFDKAEIAKTFDIADTGKDRRATVFARNASFNIARQLGLDYFMQLDDDYTAFCYRFGYTTKTSKDNQRTYTLIKSMNSVLNAMITFLEDSDALTVAMSQGGDWVGGGYDPPSPIIRKAMNSFIFRTDKPTTFIGRMNDDVNTYVTNGIRGELLFTTTKLMLFQPPTQKVAGGMSDMYRATGTYMKSMFTVMMAPSCVTVRSMGTANPRPHHLVRWNNAVPKIISDKHCKPSDTDQKKGTALRETKTKTKTNK